MQPGDNNFELEYGEGKISVQRHFIGKQVIYRIIFPGITKPLVIARAAHSDTHAFWTSVPEGRQQEAEATGALIGAYLKSFS